jgi:hypothetical protein
MAAAVSNDWRYCAGKRSSKAPCSMAHEFFRISKVQPDENGVSLSQHMDFMCPFLPPCSPFTRHNGGVFLGLPDLTWAT